MTHFATTIRPRTHQVRLARLSVGALLAILLLLTRAPRYSVGRRARIEAGNAARHKRRASQTSPTGPIQYVGPDTYILLDAEGRPQPVPGMTYEDFLAAWKKLNKPATPDSQPRFTIESIKIDGQTHGQRAELKLDVTIHLLADGSVNVPLGLVGAILQGEPRFDKPMRRRKQAAKDAASAQTKSRTTNTSISIRSTVASWLALLGRQASDGHCRSI